MIYKTNSVYALSIVLSCILFSVIFHHTLNSRAWQNLVIYHLYIRFLTTWSEQLAYCRTCKPKASSKIGCPALLQLSSVQVTHCERITLISQGALNGKMTIRDLSTGSSGLMNPEQPWLAESPRLETWRPPAPSRESVEKVSRSWVVEIAYSVLTSSR